MGQYYYPIILDKDGKIVVCMLAHRYGNGLKLMEHSWIGNNFVSTFEFALSPEGPHHKSRVVWAGDYADNEPDQEENLYRMCTEYNEIRPTEKSTNNYPIIVNHSKKLFVDKRKVPKSGEDFTIHPLPLLTAEGNGRGGGDFRDGEPLVGSWARDVISVEETSPADFEELLFNLAEKN